MAENLPRADGLPPAMTRLVKELSRLPGVGEKTASRLAFNLLTRPRDEVIALADPLLEMKERVGLCSQCFALADAPRCGICADPEREHEVIIATNATVEGEATALYLARLLKPLGVKTTRLARGLPAGGDLEYSDAATLSSALNNRREL